MEDVTLPLIFWIIGIVFLPVFYNSKLIKQKRLEKKKYFDEIDYKYSKYSHLTESKLQEIVKNMHVGYPILVVVYGVLLTFVVSQNISYTLTSWHFVLWAGWILAIIVRAGIKMSDLFDLSIIDDKKSLVFGIEDATHFFKMALYLLVPTISFLPVIYWVSVEISVKTASLSQSSVAFVSLAITFVFLLFYSVPLRNFTRRGWDIVFYMVVFLMLAFLAILPPSSPTEQVSITIGGYLSTTVPSSILAVIKFGTIFVAGVYGWYYFLFHSMREKPSPAFGD